MPDSTPTRTAHVLWRAGCVGARTSGSEGGGEQTTTSKRGTAARPRPSFNVPQWRLKLREPPPSATDGA
jgi:hypothetical protein